MTAVVDAIVVVAGIALVLLAYVDALATTVVVRSGAGPVTHRLTGLWWRVLLRLFGRRDGSPLLATAGGVLLFGTVLAWVAMLWLGWTLIFLTGDPSVRHGTTGVPAGNADVGYFTGFTLFTLGVGDFVAASPAWRFATAVASFSGLFLITLAITYLLSAVSAVVARRALAVHVHTLGTDAHGIVAIGWDGSGFSSAYVQQLVALSAEVANIAEQQVAYPILNAFHSPDRRVSAPLALAELDDALLLLDGGVTGPARVDHSAVLGLRRAIDRYLAATAGTATTHANRASPPPLDLEPLRSSGMALVADAAFAARVEDEQDRRRALAGLVHNGGWQWSEVRGGR